MIINFILQNLFDDSGCQNIKTTLVELNRIKNFELIGIKMASIVGVVSFIEAI
ncbi:hypothetical protein NSA50_09720 [Clostridium sp. DSM 100503]|uniref:hypothetical protein n=1 Tax=Clostridium sp. DSM 100503 TaxID=2963282 RepID=UPI00214A4E0A|nr:hypothetical protein [Clostridium sp. DSM 100503]MCR1951326.1 hypothetical protein [Clostridium sp. DSM 100503]